MEETSHLRGARIPATVPDGTVSVAKSGQDSRGNSLDAKGAEANGGNSAETDSMSGMQQQAREGPVVETNGAEMILWQEMRGGHRSREEPRCRLGVEKRFPDKVTRPGSLRQDKSGRVPGQDKFGQRSRGGLCPGVVLRYGGNAHEDSGSGP